MITITEEELEVILKALNYAGGINLDDSTYDDLYDELCHRAGII